MPEFVGEAITKIDGSVKGLKAHHAQKMQSGMPNTTNVKRDRKDNM